MVKQTEIVQPNQAFADPARLAVARALADLKSGQPLLIANGKQKLLVLAAEPATAQQAEALASLAGSPVFLLARRGLALHLGFKPETEASELALHAPLSSLHRLAEHWLTETGAGKPSISHIEAACPNGAAALQLAQHGAVLPLLFAAPIGVAAQKELFHVMTLDAALLSTLTDPAQHELLTTPQVALPIEADAKARAFAFRLKHQPEWHLAVLFGTPKNDALVRVHSSCLTGDILSSLRCDCGGQLHEALTQLAASGNGILVYLNQEGRGIGLGNKIKAYHLQQEGLDTKDANEALGFEADPRDFTLAALALKHLHISSIRLLTNNPRKIAELDLRGIAVRERVPLDVGPGEHNRHYLETKAARMGHLLEKKN